MFTKETENCTFLANLLEKELEKLEEDDCPEIEDLVDEKNGLARVNHSDTRLHFTAQSTKQNISVTEQGIILSCKFWLLNDL